jgi:DNA-binding LacI/PurR family transcriptional regulator
MANNITQRKIADLLGLSYPTVNRALNGYAGIHSKTQKRVMEAADRLGYHKNIVARNLVTGKTHSIGMVITNNPHSYWSTILENMESKAREFGYHVILSHSGEDIAREDEAINFLIERQVDGLILVPNHRRSDFAIFNQLAQKRIPLLFLNSRLTGINASFLGLDDIGGSIMACRHLIGLGHKRIAFVTGPTGDWTSDRRLTGYIQAMREAGLPCGDELIVPANFYLKDGRMAATKILAMQPRPTAIITMNDPLAFGIAQTFREQGIDIPNDIALVGAAGMPEGALLPSPLTTVSPPTMKMGLRAAEIVIEMIESKEPQVICEEMHTDLLIRSSCGASKTTRERIGHLSKGSNGDM